MKQHVVVATGASAGLGRAIAVAFGRQGASVALLARDPSRLAEAVAEITRAGGRAKAHTHRRGAMGRRAASNHGDRGSAPIDIWVNNAMSSIFAPFKDISMTDFERANDVTYLGFVHGTKATDDAKRSHFGGEVPAFGR
jgi:NADP-dependent 3-hydroxy acid dehydrogenase YdfG